MGTEAPNWLLFERRCKSTAKNLFDQEKTIKNAYFSQKCAILLFIDCKIALFLGWFWEKWPLLCSASLLLWFDSFCIICPNSTLFPAKRPYSLPFLPMRIVAKSTQLSPNYCTKENFFVILHPISKKNASECNLFGVLCVK